MSSSERQREEIGSGWCAQSYIEVMIKMAGRKRRNGELHLRYSPPKLRHKPNGYKGWITARLFSGADAFAIAAFQSPTAMLQRWWTL
jgi:hypothetical protein